MSVKRPVWNIRCPTKEGVYDFTCDENAGIVDEVRVFKIGKELWVTDPDVGTNPPPINHFHNNLCHPKWKMKQGV
jgi:hypothetical protein